MDVWLTFPMIITWNDNCKMKCQVLDLEQDWHAFHGSFANLFHIQIRVKEARPKDVFYRVQKLKITQ